MSFEENTIYKAPLSIKAIYIVIFFIILLILAVLFVPRLGLPGVIGMTIGYSLVAFPKIIVNGESVIIKAIAGKQRIANFDDGQFSIETLTGLKAIILGLRTKKLALSYLRNGAKAPKILAVNYPDSVIEEIFKNLPEKSKIKVHE